MNAISNIGNVVLLVGVWIASLLVLGAVAKIGYRIFMLGWGAA